MKNCCCCCHNDALISVPQQRKNQMYYGLATAVISGRAPTSSNCKVVLLCCTTSPPQIMVEPRDERKSINLHTMIFCLRLYPTTGYSIWDDEAFRVGHDTWGSLVVLQGTVFFSTSLKQEHSPSQHLTTDFSNAGAGRGLELQPSFNCLTIHR